MKRSEYMRSVKEIEERKEKFVRRTIGIAAIIGVILMFLVTLNIDKMLHS